MTNDVYEVLNLVQGSEAWLKERLKRVTASQVASLFCLSKYQTSYELLEEKLTGQETIKKNKFIFDKGHDAEVEARQWVEFDTGLKFPPLVVLSKKCNGLLASLDGFNEEQNVIFEAKYMGVDSLEDVKRGKIKPHHEYQVQAQLLASGAKYCLYFATTDKDGSAIMKILPKSEYFQKITEAVTEFMNDLKELEKFKENLMNKYRLKSQPPLKRTPSGAIDPFRVRAR